MFIDQHRLRIALVQKALTQGRAARMIGVAPSTLSAWANGLTSPPPGALDKLEQVLGLPTGSLRPAPSPR